MSGWNFQLIAATVDCQGLSRRGESGTRRVLLRQRLRLVDALLRWHDTPVGAVFCCRCTMKIVAMAPISGPATTADLVACRETTFEGVLIAVEADQPSHAWADAAYTLIFSGD